MATLISFSFPKLFTHHAQQKQLARNSIKSLHQFHSDLYYTFKTKNNGCLDFVKMQKYSVVLSIRLFVGLTFLGNHSNSIKLLQLPRSSGSSFTFVLFLQHLPKRRVMPHFLHCHFMALHEIPCSRVVVSFQKFLC